MFLKFRKDQVACLCSASMCSCASWFWLDPGEGEKEAAFSFRSVTWLLSKHLGNFKNDPSMTL